MGFYRFLRGITGLGVGVQNMAYERSQTLPSVGFSPGGHMVRQCFAATAPAFSKDFQSLPTVSSLGDIGASNQGQMLFNPLARATK